MFRSGITTGAVLGVFLSCAVARAADDQARQPPPARRPAPAPSPSRSWPSQGYIGLNAGYQVHKFSFDEVHHDTVFAEDSMWRADYNVKSGIQIDASGGYKVWKNLLAAVAYSRYRDSRAAAITAQIPHPFFFNQPRSLDGQSPSLHQDEQALHVSALWMVPATRRLEVGVFGGPSFFFVSRGFVQDVIYDESFPFDTATFNHAVVSDVNETRFGVHAGVDVTWLFTRQFGIGALVRYSRATADFATPSGGSLSIDLGGLQAGAGLRIRLNRRPPARVPPRTPVKDPRQAQPSATIPPVEVAGTTAVIAIGAPVFIAPDATRTPLRVLVEGTRVKVIDEQGAWLRIEFDDPQWGRRVGYVERKNVRIVR